MVSLIAECIINAYEQGRKSINMPREYGMTKPDDN